MFLIFIGIILAIICLVGINTGIDLKKGTGWFYILCGFLFGFLVGLSNGDFLSAIGIGFGVAITEAYAGEMLRRQRALFAPPIESSKKKRKKHE